MSDKKEDIGSKPDWDNGDKPASFLNYLWWHNRLARGSFLNDGDHPEMYFFIQNDGELFGMQFPRGINSEARRAAIMKGIDDYAPFGTIHVRIVEANPIDNQEIQDETQWCLWLAAETIDGEQLSLVNPIRFSENSLELEDTMILRDPDRNS